MREKKMKVILCPRRLTHPYPAHSGELLLCEPLVGMTIEQPSVSRGIRDDSNLQPL